MVMDNINTINEISLAIDSEVIKSIQSTGDSRPHSKLHVVYGL